MLSWRKPSIHLAVSLSTLYIAQSRKVEATMSICFETMGIIQYRTTSQILIKTYPRRMSSLVRKVIVLRWNRKIIPFIFANFINTIHAKCCRHYTMAARWNRETIVWWWAWSLLDSWWTEDNEQQLKNVFVRVLKSVNARYYRSISPSGFRKFVSSWIGKLWDCYILHSRTIREAFSYYVLSLK